MKYFSTLLVLLAASASLVASMPGKTADAAAAQASVNDAANNGAKVRVSRPPQRTFTRLVLT